MVTVPMPVDHPVDGDLPSASAAQELRRLRRAVSLVSSALPVDQVLTQFIAAAMEACGAQAGSVWLLDAPSRELEHAASIGLSEEYVEAFRRCPLGAGACGRSVETGEPELVEDSQTHPRMAAVKEAALRSGVRGLFSVPILGADGRPLGSLANHFSTPHTASSEDVERNLAYAALIGSFLERRRAEQRLVQLTRERERARHREDALAVVSHDLRSPVTAIAANAALLKRRVSSGSLEGAHRPIDAIERAAKQLGTLLTDLLDLSAMEGGRFTVEPRPHRVAELVRDALDIFRAVAIEKSIELQARVGEDCEVLCDRDRLFQVLSNLLGNALKFTPEGGSVTVTADAAQGHCRLGVSDTGIGLSEEEQRHVFDRGWRGPNAGEKGFGLGLAICKGIVEAHGGTIGVQSTPGAGTTFSFTLPTCATPAGARAAVPGR